MERWVAGRYIHKRVSRTLLGVSLMALFFGYMFAYPKLAASYGWSEWIGTAIFACIMVVYGLAMGYIIRLRNGLLAKLRETDGRLCTDCESSLVGLTGPGHCPECGAPFPVDCYRAFWMRKDLRVGNLFLLWKSAISADRALRLLLRWTSTVVTAAFIALGFYVFYVVDTPRSPWTGSKWAIAAVFAAGFALYVFIPVNDAFSQVFDPIARWRSQRKQQAAHGDESGARI